MSLADQASMAVKAGCAWIEIDPTVTDNDGLQAIINICRENEVILIFRHNDLLLEKTRVHGIHLSQGDIDPVKLRERLGGHPIIGIDVTPDSPMRPLKQADVDYIVLNGYPDNYGINDITQLRDNQLSQGLTFPIVVSGRIDTSELQTLIDAGASGFEININSLQAPEYNVALAAFKKATDNVTVHRPD